MTSPSAPVTAGGRLIGLVRLGHPFPSGLDGILTGVLAGLAGAAPERALLLAVAMIALQVSIGALNDLTDVERDRGRKPGKPIPAGLVGRRTAAALVGIGLAIGLGLSASVGPATLVVAVAGTGAGYLYDLRLKASAWAWLPFAVGIPLLPVYAWVGATGGVPGELGLVLPLAVLAGAGLSLQNGLADIECDRAAGLRTPAARLGASGSWRLAAGLQGIVLAGVLGRLTWAGPPGQPLAVAAAGAGAVVVGLTLGRSAEPRVRQRGWEVSALGLALLAAGWVIGLVELGRP